VLEAHVGDLESVAAADLALERALGLCRTRGLRPDLVVHDLHPGYVGTRIAGELAAALGAETLGVQHHHAHGLAAAVDAGLLAPCLAIVLDGLGWGGDGTLWGGEILVLEGARMARAAHLETIPIQGGGVAAREPWRAAAAWLGRAFPDGATPRLAFHARHGARDLALLARATERGINAVETSSCGRLFDAVASLLDCGDRADFEGEAALALEALAGSRPDAAKGAEADTLLCRSEPGGADVIACTDLVRSLVCDGARGLPRAALAQRFHRSLALRIAARAAEVARLHGLRDVVLSGGCFQNRLLLAAIADAITAAGLVAHSHRRLPPNDGNLAVGQVAYGLRWLSSTRR
jgi:hydrogenase maturation protein HypF